MATDPWYVHELVADVPPEEWKAAVEDSDWSEGAGEDGDEDEGEDDVREEDADYSEEESESDASDGASEGSSDAMESDVDLEARSTAADSNA